MRYLYRLVHAIPLVERDRQEIYPADFSKALIPLAQRTNWQADRLEKWRRERGPLCGMSARGAVGHDSFGLRDYSEPTRLLDKFGKYEFAYRQKAAAPVRNILTITSELVDLPAIETRLALYQWGRLTPPQTQQVLKRIGRLYKNSCWWSKKGPRRLFDKALASSDRQRWITQKDSNRVAAQLDAPTENAGAGEWRRIARGGGRVIYLGSSAKRHANLRATRADYNEQWESYLNSAGLGKALRLRGSLNIPRETIEVRNKMVKQMLR